MTLDLQAEGRRFAQAISYFTRIPVPASAFAPGHERGRSARYFPLVGTLLGTACALLLAATTQLWPDSIAVLLSMIFSLLLTGGLHEDGLADSADGFGGGFQRERVLEIMKDSRIGTFGAAALILSLLLKLASLTTLASVSLSTALMVLVLAHTVSRCAALGVMFRLDYLRPNQDSRAGAVTRRIDRNDWKFGAATAVLVLLLAAISGSTSLITLIAIVLASWVATLVCMAYFRRRIGGYTGDCLGAVQQVTELAAYLAACAVL